MDTWSAAVRDAQLGYDLLRGQHLESLTAISDSTGKTRRRNANKTAPDYHWITTGAGFWPFSGKHSVNPCQSWWSPEAQSAWRKPW